MRREFDGDGTLGVAAAAVKLAQMRRLMGVGGSIELAGPAGATHIETRYARDRIVAVYDTTGREAEAAELPLR